MLGSLTQHRPLPGVRSRLPKHSSPPARQESAAGSSSSNVSDTFETAKAKPEKPGLGQHLGRIGLGLLSLSGAIMGAAGAVTIYQEFKAPTELCLCADSIPTEAPIYEGDIQAYSDALMRQTFGRAPSCSVRDRQQTGELLQSENGRVAYDGSPVVLISFDGTFSHHPRRVPVMQELGRSLQDQGVDTRSSDFQPADIVDRSITNVTGENPVWSGLSEGSLEDIVRDPELNQNIQLLSFPSEEVEVLAGPEAWKEIRPFELVREWYDGSRDQPRNVERALDAVRDIREQATEQGLSPRFVVLTHSSGGTSAVKFAERLQSELGDEAPIDLIATLDPVREAHFAVAEGLGELAYDGLDGVARRVSGWLGDERGDSHTPTVRSSQDRLTAPTNVSEWINFYQTSDRLGVQTGPEMGIHGSLVNGAENVQIDGLGDKGHGGIATDDRVAERLLQELRERIR